MNNPAMLTSLVLLSLFAGNQEINQSNPQGVKSSGQGQFVCLPCGADCDNTLYDKPGTCTQCHMTLVNKSTVVHKNIQPDALCQMDGMDLVFLDVRSREEYNGTARDKFGRIRGAINIPVQELETRMKELDPYKNKNIVVYCSHSHRSPRASYLLTQKGFLQITNMQGGMSVWKELVKDKECNDAYYLKQ
jgi:rhodanese-related sulfurtransferase